MAGNSKRQAAAYATIGTIGLFFDYISFANDTIIIIKGVFSAVIFIA